MPIVKSKPYNSGTWTVARFNSFIKGGLRALSYKWGPIHKVRKKAWLKRGVYKCAGYKRKAHQARAKDISVDHINPVVDPTEGFISWDKIIERLFVEEDGLQVLCKDCHKRKSNDERQARQK
jgi:hypothetical protein